MSGGYIKRLTFAKFFSPFKPNFYCRVWRKFCVNHESKSRLIIPIKCGIENSDSRLIFLNAFFVSNFVVPVEFTRSAFVRPPQSSSSSQFIKPKWWHSASYNIVCQCFTPRWFGGTEPAVCKNANQITRIVKSIFYVRRKAKNGAAEVGLCYRL